MVTWTGKIQTGNCYLTTILSLSERLSKTRLCFAGIAKQNAAQQTIDQTVRTTLMSVTSTESEVRCASGRGTLQQTSQPDRSALLSAAHLVISARQNL